MFITTLERALHSSLLCFEASSKPAIATQSLTQLPKMLVTAEISMFLQARKVNANNCCYEGGWDLHHCYAGSFQDPD